jgi:hypothetical protein
VTVTIRYKPRTRVLEEESDHHENTTTLCTKYSFIYLAEAYLTKSNMIFRILALLSLSAPVQAFVLGRSGHQPQTPLFMAPRFDTSINKWVATKPEDEASAGYSVYKTLLLRGPKPFLHRVLQPDDYEQAVLKFMAGDGVDRNTAQGNMDAYLESK